MDEAQAQELLDHMASQGLADRADALDQVIDALEKELESTAEPGESPPDGAAAGQGS